MVRICTLGIAFALATSSTLAAQQNEDEQVRARQRIAMMEGTLERAVSIGADNLRRQMRAVMPDSPMLSGLPQVRGFRLEGYGVFFDVEVPAMRVPVTWSLRYIARDNRDIELALAQLKAVMTQVDSRYQEQLAQVVRRLEARMQGPTLPGPSAETVAAASRPALPGATSAPAVDPALLDDPNEGYTREIKTALIDAVIEHSGPLSLGPDEWMTVAARDNLPRDPLVPGDTADFSTVIFRVKGSDLAAFRAGRLTLDEVRRKVEVREY